MRPEQIQPWQCGSGVRRWRGGVGGLAVLAAVLLLPLLGMPLAHAQPQNDAITSATEITEIDFTDTLDTMGAEPDGPDGCWSVRWGVLNNVWYTLTLNEDTAVRLSTDGSDYFTVTDVFELTAQGNYNHVACSNSDSGDLVFTASAGTTYYMAISSSYDLGGTLVFSAFDLGPPLQIPLRPNATGSKAAKGMATVSGTVTCNYPAEIDVYGLLRQKVGRRIIVGEFATPLLCDGETPWSAIVRSDQGAFGRGRAELLMHAYGCAQYTCDDDQTTAMVRLRGK